MKLQPRPLAAICWIALLLGGCGDSTPGSLSSSAPTLRAKLPAGARVVARVNGEPLLAESLARSGDTHAGQRGALDAAIDEALLAQEAQRRGLGRDLAVRDAQRRALANLLVRRRYVDHFTKRDIPRDLVERAYQLNKRRYDRPELLDLVHILVRTNGTDSPALRKKERELANRVHAEATARRLSDAQFTALGKRIEKEAVSPLRVRVETFTTARGETVAPFERAAFALERPGDISAVVKTDFGYHVIYLKQRHAPVHRPLATVEDEIRTRIFNDARRYLLEQWLAQLRQRAGVSVDAAALRAAFPARDDS